MSGASSMPAELGRHVRECVDCRAFITRWNAIELRLQALRDESTPVSPGFDRAVLARLRDARTSPRRPRRIELWRFAIAGASAAIAGVALALYFGAAAPIKLRSPQHAAAVTSATRPAASLRGGYPVSPPLPSSLPLANAR